MASANMVMLLFIILILAAGVMSSYELHNFERIMLGSTVGPESIAFDANGEGPYTGVSDGRILKWLGRDLGWQEFARPRQRPQECNGSQNSLMEMVRGRPLGLQFHKATGDLYIADAYFGLLSVGKNGGLATMLVNEAEGFPFRSTNGLDIDQENDVVYFTDSSTNFQRKDYLVTVLSGDATGRLIKYDLKTNSVTIIKLNLTFPNGVAISRDNKFLLIAETTTCRILKYWLNGPKAGAFELFAKLPGYPDNIKRNPSGEFWVALNRQKIQLAEKLTTFSDLKPSAIKLSSEGRVMEVIGGGVLTSMSEAEESNGRLFFGSVDLPYVAVSRVR